MQSPQFRRYVINPNLVHYSMFSELIDRSFLTTQPFIVVGPGGTHFYAHEDLLAQGSPVLASGVKGKMREAENKTVVIEDVDGDLDDDTVARFIEFLYRSDYTVPSPDVLQLSTDSEFLTEAFVPRIIEEYDDGRVPASEHLTTDRNRRTRNLWNEDLPYNGVEPVASIDLVPWDYGLSKKEKMKKEKQMKREGMWDNRITQEMIDRGIAGVSASPVPTSPELELEPMPDRALSPSPLSPGPSTPKRTIMNRDNLWRNFCSEQSNIERQQSTVATNNEQREDFTNIFLCHARLYKFSERYDISNLMSLTLQKLRSTLANYTFHQTRAVDVVELIRYAYTHTMNYDNGRDKLRGLVLDYTVCYVHQLEQDESFRKLLQEGGHLPSDLLSKTVGLMQ